MQTSHATFFINNYEQRSFKYEPGTTPYFINVRNRGRNPHTLVIFANNKKHVAKILRNLISFEKECLTSYNKSSADQFFGEASQRTELLEKLLNSNTLEIEELDKSLLITLNPYASV